MRKKSLADRARRKTTVTQTPEQMRAFALHRRAFSEGQRLMRKRLTALVQDVLFDPEIGAEDIIDLVKTFPLADPPAWTTPQEKRRA